MPYYLTHWSPQANLAQDREIDLLAATIEYVRVILGLSMSRPHSCIELSGRRKSRRGLLFFPPATSCFRRAVQIGDGVDLLIGFKTGENHLRAGEFPIRIPFDGGRGTAEYFLACSGVPHGVSPGATGR
jgi:hypothetical protein